MKKELILCFNKQQALELAEKVKSNAEEFLELSYELDQYYIPRYIAEESKDLIHPIPYFAVANHEGKILLYQRGKGVGESRLLGNHSVGFGGHVELNKDCIYHDSYEAEIDSIEGSIDSATHNEFYEELVVRSYGDFKPLQIIYDESNEVGKVHLGIAMTITTEGAKILEDELLDCGWHSREELLEMQKEGKINLENWSLMLLEMIN